MLVSLVSFVPFSGQTVFPTALSNLYFNKALKLLAWIIDNNMLFLFIKPAYAI